MNAPIRPPAPAGSIEELREYTADCLRLVVLYASHAQDLAELGDDLGLFTNIRKLLAAAEAMALTVQDLRVRRCMD